MNRTIAVKGYGVFSGFLLACAFLLILTGCDLFKDNPVSDEGATTALNENVAVDESAVVTEETSAPAAEETPAEVVEETPVEVAEETPVEAAKEEVDPEKILQEVIQKKILELAGQIDLKSLDVEAIPVMLDEALLNNLAQTLSKVDPKWLEGLTLEEVIQEKILELAGQIDLKNLDLEAIPEMLGETLLKNLVQTLSEADPKWLAGLCLFLKFVKTEVNENQVNFINALEVRFCQSDHTPALPPGIPPPPSNFLPPKPVDPKASQREACGTMLKSWLKTLPKEDHFYTKPAFYICLGDGNEEKMCEIIKRELPGRPSAFGNMVFEQHCRERPQAVEPPEDPCMSILEMAKHADPADFNYFKHHYTMCSKPDLVATICEFVFKELDKNPNPYGKEIAGKYCAEDIPPPVIKFPAPSREEYCQKELQNWIKTLPKEDHFYTKPAFSICLGDGNDKKMCEIIKTELPGRPSAFGEMVFEQHCKEKPQAVEPPKDPCMSIFDKHMSPGNSHYVKLHYTICKKPEVLPEICQSMFRELDRNPTPYGKDLAAEYCADVPRSLPSPRRQTPTHAKIDSCKKLVTDWKDSMTEEDDLFYTKAAYAICVGRSKDAVCSYFERQLVRKPSNFGQTIYQENCLEDNSVQADTAAGCMAAARLHSVYFHLGIKLHYDHYKLVAYQKCDEMMYSLAEPKPLCVDLENALPTVPADSKEADIIEKAMESACN